MFLEIFTHYHSVYFRNRQIGKTALWNPGCDHAGIATQVKLLIYIQYANKVLFNSPVLLCRFFQGEGVTLKRKFK